MADQPGPGGSDGSAPKIKLFTSAVFRKPTGSSTSDSGPSGAKQTEAVGTTKATLAELRRKLQPASVPATQSSEEAHAVVPPLQPPGETDITLPVSTRGGRPGTGPEDTSMASGIKARLQPSHTPATDASALGSAGSTSAAATSVPMSQGRADLLARLAATKASRQSAMAAKSEVVPSLNAGRQDRGAAVTAGVGREESRDAAGSSVLMGGSSGQKLNLSGRSRGASSAGDNYNNGKPDAKSARDPPDDSPKSKAPKGVPLAHSSRLLRGVVAVFLFALMAGFLWFLIDLRAKALQQLKPPESGVKAASALGSTPSASVLPWQEEANTPRGQDADTLELIPFQEDADADAGVTPIAQTETLAPATTRRKREVSAAAPPTPPTISPADRRRARRAEAAAAAAATATAATAATPATTPAASGNEELPTIAAASPVDGVDTGFANGEDLLPVRAGRGEQASPRAVDAPVASTPAESVPATPVGDGSSVPQGEGRKRQRAPVVAPSPPPPPTLKMPANYAPPSCAIPELRNSLKAAGVMQPLAGSVPSTSGRRRLLARKAKHDVVATPVDPDKRPGWLDLMMGGGSKGGGAGGAAVEGKPVGAMTPSNAPASSDKKNSPTDASASAPGGDASQPAQAHKGRLTAAQRKAAAAAAFRQRAFEALRAKAAESYAARAKEAAAEVSAQVLHESAGTGYGVNGAAAGRGGADVRTKIEPVKIDDPYLYGEEVQMVGKFPASRTPLFAPPLESGPVPAKGALAPAKATAAPSAAPSVAVTEQPSMMERAAKKIAEMKGRRGTDAAPKPGAPEAGSKDKDKDKGKEADTPPKAPPFKPGHGFKVSLDDEDAAGAVWALLLGKDHQGPTSCQEAGAACGPEGDRFGLKLSNKKAAMGTCAVVAPGPASPKALENKYGQLVDAHRTVVRIGQGPLEGAEDAVGRRTTIVVVRPWVRPNGKTLGDVWELAATGAAPTATPSGGPPRIKRLPRPMGFYWAGGRIGVNGERDAAAPAIPPVGRHPSTRPYVTSRALSNTTAAADLYAALEKFVVYKGSKGEPLEPSVGLSVVVTLLHSGLCERISLFGFTLDGVGHFFDDSLGYRTGGGLSQRHVASLEKYVYSVAMANGFLCMYD